MTLQRLQLDEGAIRDFCRAYRVRELSVFGSVLTGDFRPDSDVDFLFTLDDPSNLTFQSWEEMEESLAAIVGRRVDLVPRRSVEASENPYRRNHILGTAQPVYVKR
jgi:uncharacterized protein